MGKHHFDDGSGKKGFFLIFFLHISKSTITAPTIKKKIQKIKIQKKISFLLFFSSASLRPWRGLLLAPICCRCDVSLSSLSYAFWQPIDAQPGTARPLRQCIPDGDCSWCRCDISILSRLSLMLHNNRPIDAQPGTACWGGSNEEARVGCV